MVDNKKRKSISINAALNVVRNSLTIIFPLVTYPYLTRVLGVENLGKVNFGTSVVSYFLLAAAFGITSYATREGAKIRENKIELEKLCSQLFTINIIMTIVAYTFLAILLLISHKTRTYFLLIFIQSFSILFTTLGIDWINNIFEDYYYITIRSVIINVLILILIFLFVKDSEDYYIYALLTVISNGIVCIFNFIHFRKYIVIKMTIHINFLHHFKRMFIFFINALTITIYVSADTTMLGYIVGEYYVGVYSAATKIYNTVKSILAAIYIVALPKLSKSATDDKKKFSEIVTKEFSIITLILFPTTAGIFMCSDTIILLLGGTDFYPASITLRILLLALIFAIYGGIFTQCIMLPQNKEFINMKATIFSSIINVILNFYFVSEWKHNGAAITTVIAEGFVLVYCGVFYKKGWKYFQWDVICRNIVHSLIGSLLIILEIIINFKLISSSIVALIISIIMGCVIYTIFLLLVKNYFIINIKRLIVSKIRKSE